MPLRLPLPDDASIGEEGLRLLALRAPVAVYRMVAWSPSLLPPFMGLTTAMFSATVLDDSLREAVILRVAMHHNSEYEAFHHRALAARAGLSEDDIEALLTAPVFVGATKIIRDAIAFTDACLRDEEPKSALSEVIRQALTDRGICELSLLIGFYRMVATFLRATGVPLDAATSTALGAPD